MAPFRPAAPCVLSAGGVDDRKSIELWLSLHTSDSFPVEQCLCENGAWWSVKCGPCCTLAVWTEEVSLVRRLSPLCLAGASLFTSYQLSLSPASLSLSLSLSSIRNYIGKFYLLQGCWQPWRTGKIQFNNLLLPTHLQAQRDSRAENTGWALAALWLLLDHFLSDR